MWLIDYEYSFNRGAKQKPQAFITMDRSLWPELEIIKSIKIQAVFPKAGEICREFWGNLQ